MNTLKYLIVLTLLTASPYVSLMGQVWTGSAASSIDSCWNGCVYPGDANNDGIVDKLDVLTVGWGFGNIGIARSNVSQNWGPNTSTDWAGQTPSGVNYKHADCNGDGTIDLDDLSAIYQNFSNGFSKSSSVQTDPSGVPFYMILNKDTFAGGDTVIADLMLGTSEIPAEDIYGFIVSVSYPDDLLHAENVLVDFSSSWLIDGSGITFFQNNPEERTIDIAISRIDQSLIDGYGNIGSISFIVEDNLDEKSIAAMPIRIQVEDIYLTNYNISGINMNVDQEVGGIVANGRVSKDFEAVSSNVIAYPLPFADHIKLHGINYDIDLEYRIYTISGKEVQGGALKSNLIHLNGFSNGVYVLKITGAGISRDIKIMK